MNNNDNEINKDYEFMYTAMEQAQVAYKLGYSPVGAVLVDLYGHPIGKEYSQRSIGNILHAEYMLLSGHGTTGYDRMTLYTTLEPCLMCTGMAIVGKIERVVYLLDDFWGSGPKNIKHSTDYMQSRSTRIEQYPIKTTEDKNLHVICTTMWKTHLVATGHEWALKGMLGVGQ